ncbi:MAG: glycosyltransferase family 2 protein [Phycisphaerae bacterium]|nr:glycosyltransferase family 2 protein [Phycisphaerae bacterium]
MSTNLSNPASSDALSLSIVVPVFNEAQNVQPLVDDIVREADELGCTYELILVNDGSTDGSEAALDQAAEGRPQVKVIHFAANRGQTIAIRAGLEAASGRRWVTLDGDRQNDPSDMGPLLKRLEEGFVCVSGWRKDRQDNGLRKFVSRVANGLIRKMAQSPVHDLGCTLKAYRSDALEPGELFGEMHRFLAILAAARGPVAEMVVKHHPRTAGISKYGLNRTARVIADVLLLRILLRYPTRPSHLFARIAQWLVLAGGAMFVLGLIDAWVYPFTHWLGSWFVPAVLLAVGGVVVLSGGLVAELVVRNRYLTTGERPYRVARRVNFDGGHVTPGRHN